MEPMEALKKGIVTPEELKGIFSVVKSILQLHTTFLHDLENEVNVVQTVKLGKLFISLVTPDSHLAATLQLIIIAWHTLHRPVGSSSILPM